VKAAQQPLAADAAWCDREAARLKRNVRPREPSAPSDGPTANCTLRVATVREKNDDAVETLKQTLIARYGHLAGEQLGSELDVVLIERTQH